MVDANTLIDDLGAFKNFSDDLEDQQDFLLKRFENLEIPAQIYEDML